MVILDLLERLSAVADGAVVVVPITEPGDVDTVRRWCDHSGNTLLAVEHDTATVRRGRAPDPLLELPSSARPGSRLWIYTNFDCNLACDYCCVRSSPQTPRRALSLEQVRQLATEGAAAGVREILLTGGEPFLLPDLDELATECASRLPTTLLTNGMLFRGRRLDLLRRLPRDVRLQISLDSANPDEHDRHRGRGSWDRAIAGIRTAVAEGFRVRVAATLVDNDPAGEHRLRAVLDSLAVATQDQILRPLAHQGFATGGVHLTRESLIPEITVTSDGVYWHPVAADDASLLVSTQILPLAPAITQVQDLFRTDRLRASAAARAFPCA